MIERYPLLLMDNGKMFVCECVTVVASKSLNRFEQNFAQMFGSTAWSSLLMGFNIFKMAVTHFNYLKNNRIS